MGNKNKRNNNTNTLSQFSKKNKCCIIINNSNNFNNSNDEDLIKINNLNKNLYKYERLYNEIYSYIAYILTLIKQQNFTSLQEEVSSQIFLDLGQKLLNNSFFTENYDNTNYVYDSNTFENYKDITFEFLDGLIPTIEAHNNSNYYLSELEELKSILNDRTKLAEWIQENFNSSNIVSMDIMPPVSLKPSLNIVLRPEFMEYIDNYGLPENGIFEIKKLAEIMESINN